MMARGCDVIIGENRMSTTSGSARSLRFVPAAHESAHLGDEFTILAEQAFRQTFERINVSYEYWDHGVSFDTLFGCGLVASARAEARVSPGDRFCHQMTLRHGGLRPWGDEGYYSGHFLGEDDSGSITLSRDNYEPSFGTLLPTGTHGLSPENEASLFQWMPATRSYTTSTRLADRMLPKSASGRSVSCWVFHGPTPTMYRWTPFCTTMAVSTLTVSSGTRATTAPSALVGSSAVDRGSQL